MTCKNKLMYLHILLCFCITFSFSSSIFAAPNILNYQGTLLDDLNQPINGGKNIIFKIYDVSTGGTALWTSSGISVNVKNGIFNAAIEGIPEDLFLEDNRYIEVLVDNQVLEQRKRLASVPYALNAGSANSGGIPAGGIIMWSGAVNEIPEGWALCDGQNGTPDLRDRFIVGAGSAYSVSDTGGKLQNDFHVNTAGAHQHRMPIGFDAGAVFGWADAGGIPIFGSYVIQPASGKKYGEEHKNDVAMRLAKNELAGGHSHQVYEADTPSTSVVENRPPFFALCFILKLPQ